MHWDGESLRLRLPDGGFHTLHGVQFRYGQKEILQVLERNRVKETRVGLI